MPPNQPHEADVAPVTAGVFPPTDRLALPELFLWQVAAQLPYSVRISFATYCVRAAFGQYANAPILDVLEASDRLRALQNNPEWWYSLGARAREFIDPLLAEEFLRDVCYYGLNGVSGRESEDRAACAIWLTICCRLVEDGMAILAGQLLPQALPSPIRTMRPRGKISLSDFGFSWYESFRQELWSKSAQAGSKERFQQLATILDPDSFALVTDKLWRLAEKQKSDRWAADFTLSKTEFDNI